MAKRNADKMFEKLSPISGEGSMDRASVFEHAVNTAPMDAIDGTGSGNSGRMAASTFYRVSEPGVEQGYPITARSPRQFGSHVKP
jgi:hypothetical protein